ncbi:YeeE/YedE thiosulfate transporter family protein [Acidocella sp.]|uniref:YeeE/YedE thiosulfate transporter family protein n=1 Tax=Acidocella sp. TaxID=50710 RepID=UPI00262738D0|nr:YeeE/YedE thiosulfate transporter family protein [Acidocella sp.]
MIAPFGFNGPVSGLLCGIGFGFVLEGAGFANPELITSQLRFTNWTVMRVMLTAIITCAALLYGGKALGVINFGLLFIPSVYFWGTLLGGAGVGIGMALGGYCPGTSAVALSSGRLDGLVFLLGIGAGTLGFNALYPVLKSWVYAQTGPSGLTVPQWLGAPAWMVIVALAAVLGLVGWLTARSPKS